MSGSSTRTDKGILGGRSHRSLVHPERLACGIRRKSVLPTHTRSKVRFRVVRQMNFPRLLPSSPCPFHLRVTHCIRIFYECLSCACVIDPTRPSVIQLKPFLCLTIHVRVLASVRPRHCSTGSIARRRSGWVSLILHCGCLILLHRQNQVPEQLAPSRLLRLLCHEVAAEGVAVVVCQYEAFVVELPVALVEGDLEYLCKLAMCAGVNSSTLDLMRPQGTVDEAEGMWEVVSIL
ncbi:hypothetical protein DE146DRAFT_671123 [Phaeosphaeria sp. MPI-PUGE-AT-0046c]|nr:hypothetical protein DE146DRAFT_671123 [Phaeosphaeria sp. MPI-PUGE-AT-0046c]